MKRSGLTVAKLRAVKAFFESLQPKEKPMTDRVLSVPAVDGETPVTAEDMATAFNSLMAAHFAMQRRLQLIMAAHQRWVAADAEWQAASFHYQALLATEFDPASAANEAEPVVDDGSGL